MLAGHHHARNSNQHEMRQPGLRRRWIRQPASSPPLAVKYTHTIATALTSDSASLFTAVGGLCPSPGEFGPISFRAAASDQRQPSQSSKCCKVQEDITQFQGHLFVVLVMPRRLHAVRGLSFALTRQTQSATAFQCSQRSSSCRWCARFVSASQARSEFGLALGLF